MATPATGIDARVPVAAPPPAPIPGFVPLVPLAPAPIPPFGIAPFGIAPFGTPQFGLPPAPVPAFGMPLGAPPSPIPMMGLPPAPIAPPFGAPQFGIAPFGMPLGVPPAPVPGVIPPVLPVSAVASVLLPQIALKDVASRLGDAALKGRVIAGLNEAITRSIQDLAGGTLLPWSGVGAPTGVYPVVASLALLAHTLPEGAMRAELLDLAGQLLQKGLAPTGEGPTGGGQP